MQPVRFPVKLSTALRVGYVGVGVLCLSMAADSAGADVKTQLLAWGFFGVGGLLVLKLMLRNTGWLTCREDGLLIDTHWSTGLIRWEDLQPPREVKVWGMSYLGLTTSDPEGYLKSREQLEGLINETDRVFTQGFMRGMFAILNVLPPAKIAVNLGVTLCGWAPLPKSTTEAEIMHWQEKSYGAQIILHRLWIPNFSQVLSELRSRAHGTVEGTNEGTKPADGESSFQPRLHRPQHPPQRSPSSLKTCPMCAEEVQTEAKICRFCRYSFEDQRLLPSA